MAGIYIHIPFCKKACIYCDFHFSTTVKNKALLVDAICKEIFLQQNYLNGEQVETIYFGGGTPSMLNPSELGQILEAISSCHSIVSNPEITLEANPDDLTRTKTTHLKDLGINRLSIGIQSFFQEDLDWMNRAHSSKQALDAIENSLNVGIENLSIDLIFATPKLNDKKLTTNINTATNYPINHISLYGLTLEKKTALWHSVERNKIAMVDDETYKDQFLLARKVLEEKGFDAYEVSNFARENQISKHNSSYWLGRKYLGIGPSAHSYNGNTRQWNQSNNQGYIKAISTGRIPFELEELTQTQLFNEFILTRLRTKWGISLVEMKEEFGAPTLNTFLEKIQIYLGTGELISENNSVKLTQKGLLLADKISADLFK